VSGARAADVREVMMLDLKKLEAEVQYVTNQAGEKTAVILPLDEFKDLLEDVEDLAAIAERRDEPTISHDELLAELKRDGLV
jgi:PHD/YefM family antitoxin component YafN of YafNO toxin-antitoxin module